MSRISFIDLFEKGNSRSNVLHEDKERLRHTRNNKASLLQQVYERRQKPGQYQLSTPPVNYSPEQVSVPQPFEEELKQDNGNGVLAASIAIN